MKNYDVHFNDNDNSNAKGFDISLLEAKNYISCNNGSNNSYFSDYKGGSVSIICNTTGECMHSEIIK